MNEPLARAQNFGRKVVKFSIPPLLISTCFWESCRDATMWKRPMKGKSPLDIIFIFLHSKVNDYFALQKPEQIGEIPCGIHSDNYQFKYQHVYCKKCSFPLLSTRKIPRWCLRRTKAVLRGNPLSTATNSNGKVYTKATGKFIKFFQPKQISFSPGCISISIGVWKVLMLFSPFLCVCLQPQTRASVFQANSVANNWDQELCYCGPLGGRSTQRGLVFAVTVTNADQRK